MRTLARTIGVAEVCHVSLIMLVFSCGDVTPVLGQGCPFSTEGRTVTEAEEIVARLDRMESLLRCLVEREQVRDWHTVGQFAQLVQLTPYTVREHCRSGRIRAKKRAVGHGASLEWIISREEYLRYQRDGLLPLARVPIQTLAG